jgi:hypothetical protein
MAHINSDVMGDQPREDMLFQAEDSSPTLPIYLVLLEAAFQGERIRVIRQSSCRSVWYLVPSET